MNDTFQAATHNSHVCQVLLQVLFANNVDDDIHDAFVVEASSSLDA